VRTIVRPAVRLDGLSINLRDPLASLPVVIARLLAFQECDSEVIQDERFSLSQRRNMDLGWDSLIMRAG
jgi:hypothetical protein